MAFGKQADRATPAMAEINIIPFVDVVLVLLLIFMLTAPMMYRGIDVNLPEAASRPTAVNCWVRVTAVVSGSGVTGMLASGPAAAIQPSARAVRASRSSLATPPSAQPAFPVVGLMPISASPDYGAGRCSRCRPIRCWSNRHSAARSRRSLRARRAWEICSPR